jgi:hypothetical protein
MTPDNLTTAARAAGYALAGEPQDSSEREETAVAAPLLLPRPETVAVKPLDATWWRELFAFKALRAPA